MRNCREPFTRGGNIGNPSFHVKGAQNFEYDLSKSPAIGTGIRYILQLKASLWYWQNICIYKS